LKNLEESHFHLSFFSGPIEILSPYTLINFPSDLSQISWIQICDPTHRNSKYP